MTKYSDDLGDQIVNLIKEGNFASYSYTAYGLSKDTFYRWLKEKTDFSDKVKKAKGERITSLITAIRKDQSWQSKAWLLERLDRTRYHLPTATEREIQERLEGLEQYIQELSTNRKNAQPNI